VQQVQQDNRDLTLRQMAVSLADLSRAAAAPRSRVAATLGVTKPVITRALDTMGEMGWTSASGRPRPCNVIIKRTVSVRLLERFGDLVIEKGANVGICEGLMALDRRLNAYREDLAEKSLEGQVAARASLPENRRGSIFRLPPFVPN